MGIVRIVGFAAVLWILPALASAAPRCGAVPADAAQLAAAQAALAKACSCVPGDFEQRNAFLRCVGHFVSSAVRRGTIRSECRAKLRHNATRSTCGRPAGAVVCCRAASAGEASCRIATSADACLSSRARRAWLGAGTSCADACTSACTSSLDCDDGDSCTADACSPSGSCTNTPIAGCTIAGGPTNCQGTAAATWEMDRDELDVLSRLNAERARRGVPLLRPCRSLAKAAQKHAADMRDRDYVSHYSPERMNYLDRICRAGFTRCRSGFAMGEILMAGSNRSEMAFAAWMNSPSHRDIVLHNALRMVGVGHACGGRYTGYWVANFSGTDDPSCD